MGWEGKDKAHQDPHELEKWEWKKDWAALSQPGKHELIHSNSPGDKALGYLHE